MTYIRYGIILEVEMKTIMNFDLRTDKAYQKGKVNKKITAFNIQTQSSGTPVSNILLTFQI